MISVQPLKYTKGSVAGHSCGSYDHELRHDASMEESTTESECDDDAEELSTADVRWENSNSYLNIAYNYGKDTRCTLYFSGCHYVVWSDT